MKIILKNLRHDTIRTFGIKEREYLKGKINELETNNESKITEICKEV
jgi:hypothetical protein